jgi:hypothetical protein
MRQVPSTGRRILWTVGVGLGGFFLGGKGGGLWGTILSPIWGASIGYGFGAIFDQKHPTKRLVIYWAATLALVGSFFGLLIGAGVQPYPSTVQLTVAGTIGALVGALFGLLFGTMQLRRLRRRWPGSHSGAVA